MSGDHEKRDHPRAPLEARVRYRIAGQKWRETRSRDISVDGMMLQSDDDVTPGDRVHLQFILPNARYQDPIDTEAEVMRVIVRHGRQVGMGLQFLTMRANQFQLLQEFVSRILGLPVSGRPPDLELTQNQTRYQVPLDHLIDEAAEDASASEMRKIGLRGPSRYDRAASLARWTLLILGGAAALFVLWQILKESSSLLRLLESAPK